MKQGFVKVAAATPDLKVADVSYNITEICKMIDQAQDIGCKVLVFPELCICGYTCGDLFTQDMLLTAAEEGLEELRRHTVDKDMLVFVGIPLAVAGKLYNTAAAINHGKILGFTTKTFLPNYAEFYEKRQFTEGPKKARTILYRGEEVLFGPQLLFQCQELPDLIVAAEICEDAWAPIPPSLGAAISGAVLIANCSASSEGVGKGEYRRALISGQSARSICGYIYANAGTGESTTDLVFGGQNLIAENGAVLAESETFTNQMITTEIDIKRLVADRRRNTTFETSSQEMAHCVSFSLTVAATKLTRSFAAKPFVPAQAGEQSKRWDEILMIQACGLKKRLQHTGSKTVVLGISGGLDSTLALLVIVKAFEMMGKDLADIIAVTMPCFGTTGRTYKNACAMTKSMGATLREVPIKESVLQHFADIGHDPEQHDVTFENAQARERTQVLMDIANQCHGLVIGTGDMSELALGWATFNGDQMSMYGVNASIPKTLVRYLVKHYANTCDNAQLKEILEDVLETPVSPELLPPKDGEIAQKTEDLVGPYELHDFYLYYMLRFGYEPAKIFRLAQRAFEGTYSEEVILSWMEVFYRRFFGQQFKRSAMPDGPKVGSVALSPRGDLRMPSDACATLWMAEVKRLQGGLS